MILYCGNCKSELEFKYSDSKLDWYECPKCHNMHWYKAENKSVGKDTIKSVNNKNKNNVNKRQLLGR